MALGLSLARVPLSRGIYHHLAYCDYTQLRTLCTTWDSKTGWGRGLTQRETRVERTHG